MFFNETAMLMWTDPLKTIKYSHVVSDRLYYNNIHNISGHSIVAIVVVVVVVE